MSKALRQTSRNDQRAGPRERSSIGHLARGLVLIRPHWNVAALCIFLLLAEGGAALGVPLVAGELVQSLWASGNGLVGIAIVVLIFLVSTQAVLAVAGHYLLSALGEDVVADLRMMLYQHLQRLPIAFHERRARGALLSILSYDTEAASDSLVHGIISSVPLIGLSLGAAAMLVWLQPQLGLVAVLALPCFILLGRRIAGRLRPLATRVHQLEADGMGLAESHLRALKVTKLFGAEDQLASHFDAHRCRARLAGKRLAMVTGLIEPGSRVIGTFAILLVLWMASTGMFGMAMGVGDMVAFFLYGTLLTRPLGGLVGLYGEVHQGGAAMERIQSILNESPEPSGDYSPVAGSVRGRLEVRNVCFSYPGQKPLLTGVSFDLNPGEIVAITGPNGVGKTTMLHLVAGYMRPDAGRVLLDGIETRNWDLKALRGCISLVSQEIEWLPLSVRRNLTIGNETVDHQRLAWALALSKADTVIERLSRGLDALLGPVRAVSRFDGVIFTFGDGCLA